LAEPERLEPMEPPFSLLRRQRANSAQSPLSLRDISPPRGESPSREAKCGTKMVSIILCAPYGGMRNEPLSTTNS